jgi:hypothetical protein
MNFRENIMVFNLKNQSISSEDIQKIKITTELDGFTSVEIYAPESLTYTLDDPGVEALVDWYERNNPKLIEYEYNIPF